MKRDNQNIVKCILFIIYYYLLLLIIISQDVLNLTFELENIQAFYL